MLRNDPKITAIMHDSLVKAFATEHKISLEESKKEIANMSFMQYHTLLEAGANIVPPSGNTIGPAAQSPAAPPSANAQQPNQHAQTAPTKQQVMWAGKGSPIEKGMTVGLKGQNGLPMPGEITNVDQSRKGVTVKNPTTGQEEQHGFDDLEQYTSSNTPNQPSMQQQQAQRQMAEELARMKQLAGIAEDASGGASCAGAMGAGTPQPLGKKMIKRSGVEESSIDEYTPTVAKTVVGDTKPSQDSGKLSARLAKAGKPTATRKNNGFRT